MRHTVMMVMLGAAAGLGGALSAREDPPMRPSPDPTTRPNRPAPSPCARWANGPPADEDYFPIAVWLQHPRNAARYKQAGINLYVGLWKGPTEEQLAALRKARMPVICDQNAIGLAHRDDPIIVGWMHGDEPDNAQPLGAGKGYGPPIPPERIVADYQRIRQADPTRPVLLNLGQGVAWDAWHGRGVRTNRPEDYPEYVKGCDIASFDIYPVAHPHPEVAGKLWYVARGVERLVRWTGQPPAAGEAAGRDGPATRPDDGGARVVWNCIECTRINSDRKATPHHVRAEVWMSLIHGSRGLIYFVHEWRPRFNEHALLDDAEMLAAVTALNRRIHSLAAVLNGPALPADAAAVVSDNADVSIALTARRRAEITYLFAVAMRDGRTRGRFTVAGLSGRADVEVLDEDRTLTAVDGRFADTFGPWDVRLYAIRPPAADR